MDSHPAAQRGGIDRWAELALDELGGLTDVRRVGIALVEGGGRRLLFTANDRRRDAPDTWCHVDAFSPVPLNDVLGTGRMLTGSLEQLDTRYSAYVAAQQGTGFRAVAAVELRADDRALGGFVLYYGSPQAFDARQHDELQAVADRLANDLRDALNQPLPTTIDHYRPPQGSLVAEHEIPPDPAAVGQARRFLGQALADWRVDEEMAAQAVLCLSELVTNALVHTFGGCHVQVELHDGVLTTRVHDNGSSIVPHVAPSAEALRGDGHGLQLVDALASSWGRTDDPHATAWFSLQVS